MKIFLESIGCRLNQGEIDAIARRLLAAGHEVVGDAGSADRVVINTCAVTSEAARDARKLTRRIHRASGRAGIVLTGCYATLSPEEAAALDGVELVVGNDRKDEIPGLIDAAIGPRARGPVPGFDIDPAAEAHDLEPILRDRLARREGRTRAFIKVQDGCDNQCTFCVTTVARGRGRSRPIADVVAEIDALCKAGYREAVLTGVHLGSYGRDLTAGGAGPRGRRGAGGLGALIASILERTGIPRLRVSSLEPWDLTPEFFDLWRDPRLLPHLHLPLQSGSDRVLRRMARNTSRAAFATLVTAARQRIPRLAVTTDVIVGFPGETDEDFEETLGLVGELELSRLHVFSYSPRPGTAAAAMPGQVPDAVKRERARRMIDAGRALALRFHKRHVGRRASVLWERGIDAEGGDRIWGGYTENYIRVTMRSRTDLFNRITGVELADAGPDGCAGRLSPEMAPPPEGAGKTG